MRRMASFCGRSRPVISASTCVAPAFQLPGDYLHPSETRPGGPRTNPAAPLRCCPPLRVTSARKVVLVSKQRARELNETAGSYFFNPAQVSLMRAPRNRKSVRIRGGYTTLGAPTSRPAPPPSFPPPPPLRASRIACPSASRRGQNPTPRQRKHHLGSTDEREAPRSPWGRTRTPGYTPRRKLRARANFFDSAPTRVPRAPDADPRGKDARNRRDQGTHRVQKIERRGAENMATALAPTNTEIRPRQSRFRVFGPTTRGEKPSRGPLNGAHSPIV